MPDRAFHLFAESQGVRPARRSGTRATLLCAAAVAAMAAGAAAAQPAGSSAAEPAPSAAVSGTDAAAAVDAIATAGEVVVTARHRVETAQSVPATVSVVGGDFIAKTNTTSLVQLVKYLPSVQFSFFNPRNSSLNIRGLGNATGVASDGIEPGVGFYVDQVYYNRPAAATFDLVDIDQVEVLEGPQGTLFGKNTTAGVVNITTRAPSFTPEAAGQVSGGNYGYFVAKGTVSGPLIDNVLAGRLSVSTSQRNGLATNDYNGEKVNGYRNLTARGQLLYTPAPDLKLRFIADYSKQYINGGYQTLSGIVTPPNGKNFVAMAEHFGYTPVVDPFGRHVDVNTPVFARQETGGVSLEADYDLPHAVLTSITAWRFWNWWPGNDIDYTPLSIMTAANLVDHENQLTQEFRIASSGENKVDYVAGLYFFREQIKADAVQRYGSEGSYFLLGPAVPSVVLNGYGLTSNASNNTTSYAAYGQATWHVTPKWSLTGGLRYTYDRKTGRFDQTVGGGAPLTGPLAALAFLRTAIAAPVSFKEALDQGKLSGQANLSYQAADDVLTYVTVARGYRSGGINLTQLPPGATSVIAPESIDSVEVGAKTRLFDRRVTLNTSLFYERDKNYQGTVTVTGTTRTYLANIPKVESKGVEVSLRAEPSSNLSLYANGVYDDAKFVSFPNAPCGLENVLSTNCDLSGRPLLGVPLWTASAGGEYRHPLTLGPREVEAYVGLDDSFRSSVYSTSTVSIYTRLPSLNLLDARIGIRAADGRWDAFLWGKNITDKKYYVSTGPGIGNTGALLSALGDPATFGATLRARY
jgi:iron complex outermembrane receptor protein